MKIRQDAWSSEEDELLAQVVLRHIRSGSTQLKAFEEVAVQVQRTPAACGFRWNAAIRKQCSEQIEEAKASRKQQGIVVDQAMNDDGMNEETRGVAEALDAAKKAWREHAEEYEQLQALLDKQKEEKQHLQEKVIALESELSDLTEKYQSFMRVIAEAREWSKNVR
ncbi:RsfA family transcriptional regulator [Bacillaceae bacterium SIJ1]|uniref:RsfA family transcriptional regulator n=1 Tax=Litoribacterium kuwaitense TaxID=1398745 RepID=UPI0013EA05D2|nr:RsfA family transcriptional regulator [Litoribacterium kuwaitense]NGP44354.1 RsfA family transcriptional regulator [Litoribacterium kuwaitense]